MKKIIIIIALIGFSFLVIKGYEQYLINKLLQCKANAGDGNSLYNDIGYCFEDIPAENETIEDKLAYSRNCSNGELRQQKYACESILRGWDDWWFEHFGYYKQKITL